MFAIKFISLLTDLIGRVMQNPNTKAMTTDASAAAALTQQEMIVEMVTVYNNCVLETTVTAIQSIPSPSLSICT
jgi:hypothetical protein